MTINKVLQEKNMGIENAELKAILNLLKGWKNPLQNKFSA